MAARSTWRGWKRGTRARWNIPDGGLVEVVRFIGDDGRYYEVLTIPERRTEIAREDELVVVEDKAQPQNAAEED
jgi:hypothetical protein